MSSGRAATVSDRTISRALAGAVALAVVLAAVSFFNAPGRKPATRGDDGYEFAGAAFEVADFDALEGWRADDLSEALPALLLSCARILTLAREAPLNPAEAPGAASLGGRAADWFEPCLEARSVADRPYADDNARRSAVRSYFEYHFRPVKIFNRLAPKPGGPAEGRAPKLSAEGRFTAYFEPFYDAAAAPTPVFSAPVYRRPADLVTVDLARFRPELAGQRIAGRIVDGALDPYPDHAAINAGALAGRAEPIAYMRPTDLLFLQIQGSGRLMVGGREMRVGYDGHNGHVYTAVGKTLLDMKELEREKISMQTIKAWLDAAPPAAARSVRESNRSYIFFRPLEALDDPSLGPPGAQGVQLTPGRSIAVDPRFVPFGAPVFVSIPGDADKGEDPIRRLFIAQDMGGAIKGGVRGDIFIGSGPAAGAVAGAFNEMGAMVALTPRSVAARLPAGPPRP